MLSYKENACQFNQQVLSKKKVGIGSVTSLFLISTSWNLISTIAYRNGSVFVCRVAGSSGAIGVKSIEHEFVR